MILIFRNGITSGIKAPDSNEIIFVNPLSVFLGGQGSIAHILQQGDNMIGPSVTSSSKVAYICPQDRSIAS